MKTLIVEDDFTSRLMMQEYLKSYGPCHIAIHGKEAVAAVRMALEAGEPYDLIVLDIMMPEMDGQQALKEIRNLEACSGIFSSQCPDRWTRRPNAPEISSTGAKIIMTTALADAKNISTAYTNMSDAYLTKPIRKAVFLEELRKLKLIDEPAL